MIRERGNYAGSVTRSMIARNSGMQEPQLVPARSVLADVSDAHGAAFRNGVANGR